MKSKNAKIWQQYGLTEEGAIIADKLMPTMLDLVKDQKGIGKSFLYVVLEEAAFQTQELPSRTKKFQKEYKWKKQ
jgi:hypothetical protein